MIKYFPQVQLSTVLSNSLNLNKIILQLNSKIYHCLQNIIEDKAYESNMKISNNTHTIYQI